MTVSCYGVKRPRELQQRHESYQHGACLGDQPKVRQSRHLLVKGQGTRTASPGIERGDQRVLDAALESEHRFEDLLLVLHRACQERGNTTAASDASRLALSSLVGCVCTQARWGSGAVLVLP